MSKRKAAALSPPLDQTVNESKPRQSARLMTAASRTDEQPDAVAAAATQPTASASTTAAAAAAAAADPVHGPQPTCAAAADSSAADGGAASRGSVSSCPFGRLAAVELQLVMHGCDRRALMALARCSRSTLTAAAHPFAWKWLPLQLHCSRPSELTAWRPLHSAGSLLRHADLSVSWTLESAAAATSEEVAAVLALPRLRSLAVAVANGYGRAWGGEPKLCESASILLVNALRSQLSSGRPSSNFVWSLSMRNQLISAACAAAVTSLIEHSQSLTSLDLKRFDRNPGHTLVALVVAAGNSSGLRSLKLSLYDEVDAAAAAALARALTQSRSLTELKLCSFLLDAAAVKALAAGVKASGSLQRLHLDDERNGPDNLLGDEATVALAAAVAESRSLTELGLDGWSIGDDGVAALDAAVQQCSSMRRLRLYANLVDGASVAALGRSLSADHCKLVYLLAFLEVDDAEVVALAEALQFNTSLTELRLPCCPNLAAFVVPLAAALQRSGGRSALRTLELGDIDIEDSAVITLSNLLRSAQALRQLEFDFCNLSAADAAALAPSIGTSGLTCLEMRNSSLGDASLAALVPGLCACPGLRKILLFECGLTSASAADLARVVQQCRALEWLDVSANKIGDDGACAIFAALHSGSSLCRLLLHDDDTGVRVLTALIDALDRGWNPTHIKLATYQTSNINDSVPALAAALEQRGPTLRLEWLRIFGHGLSVDAAVALVRAVHRIPNMRSVDLSCSFRGDDHAAMAAVRARAAVTRTAANSADDSIFPRATMPARPPLSSVRS